MTTTEAPLLPTFRWKPWHGIVLGFLGLLVAGVLAFAIFKPIRVLPRMRLAPGFALKDQSDRIFTNEDLRGQFVLYNFTYTGCQPPDCPQTDAIMQDVYRRLGEAQTDGVPVSLVTMSFDPERDTPQQLAAYAQNLGADPEQWRFLTGEPNRLKSIIGGGFGVYYEPIVPLQEGGGFTFNPTLVLVDGLGIVRAVYNNRTTLPDADRILRHLGVLGEEVRNSQGMARLGYEAAHLFLCYAS